MSVNAETPIASSTANGVTTSFPYAFTVLSAADLVVQGVLSGITTVYTYGVHYTLTGLGTDAGSVEFLSPPANGTVITRYRSSELKRTTDYQDNGDLLAETLNRDLDGLWLALQELASGASGAPGSAEQLAALLAASTGSSRIGHILNAAGAVERTLQSRLRDRAHVRDFGITGSGNETAKLQLALNAGVPLDFGWLTITHSGVTATVANGGKLSWYGNGARLNYTGVVGIGVRITTPAGAVADLCEVDGVTFFGGPSQLRIQGDEVSKAKFRRVKVRGCQFFGNVATPLDANLRIEYADDVEVSGCYAQDANDNGLYTAFCSRVNIHHNVTRNCAGIGIAAGYVDELITYGGLQTIIDSNIVIQDDNANPALNYQMGIDAVFCKDVRVSNNIVVNQQATATLERSYRSGIVVEEFTCDNVVIADNTVVNMLLTPIRVGTNPNSVVSRLRIAGNKLYKAGQRGVEIAICEEALEVVDNEIDSVGQDGIWIGPRSIANAAVRGNTLRHVGIQPTFAAYAGVKVEGGNVAVTDNDFFCGHVAIFVTSTAPTPSIRVQASNNTIYLRESGVDVASTSFAAMTFAQVAQWIRGRAGWGATVYPQTPVAYSALTAYVPGDTVVSGGTHYRCTAPTTGNAPPNATYWSPETADCALPAVTYLRRTGNRISAEEISYAVPPGGLNLTSYEPELVGYFAYPKRGNCSWRGNRLHTYALELGAEAFFKDGGGVPYLWEKPDSLTDQLESGGGRAFVGSALNGQLTPASLPTNRYYLRGDTFVSSNPALMPGRYTCVTPGFGTNAVWKPYTGTGVGLVTPIANGARATTTVAVLPVLVGAENQVTVTIDVDAKGLKVFGYVSASGVVTVVYENHTGGSVTLSAHTLRVYVS